MPNAHSHAFQRDLRGLGERSEPPTTSGAGARRCMRSPQALDPDSMQRVAARVYGEMAAAGYGAVGEFHYVHHQPDGTPYEDPNALAVAVAQAALDGGPARSSLLPAAYHRGGHPRFQRPDVEASWRASTRCASGPTGARLLGRRGRAFSVRAVPPDWLEAIAAYAVDARARPPRPRARAAARAARVPRRARRQPDRAARAHRLPGTADERHPRASTSTSATWPRSPTATRSSSPARRPRATSATARCRRSPTATPGCAWPSARTRRSASTPSRRRASSRPAPAGSA